MCIILYCIFENLFFLCGIPLGSLLNCGVLKQCCQISTTVCISTDILIQIQIDRNFRIFCLYLYIVHKKNLLKVLFFCPIKISTELQCQVQSTDISVDLVTLAIKTLKRRVNIVCVCLKTIKEKNYIKSYQYTMYYLSG